MDENETTLTMRSSNHSGSVAENAKKSSEPHTPAKPVPEDHQLTVAGGKLRRKVSITDSPKDDAAPMRTTPTSATTKPARRPCSSSSDATRTVRPTTNVAMLSATRAAYGTGSMAALSSRTNRPAATFDHVISERSFLRPKYPATACAPLPM